VKSAEQIRKGQPRWLSLGAAAEFVGVDGATLRGWADAGKVRVYRTPGGHRRFSLADLESLLRESSPSTPRSLTRANDSTMGAPAVRQWLTSRAWYPRIGEYSRTRVRACCAELVQLLAAYTAGQRAQPQDLAKARHVGELLGREVAGCGLTPADSAEVFLHFKRHVTEALAVPPRDAPRQVRIMREADAFLGEVLQAVMEAYKMAGGSEAGLPAAP
jgi:excisionase family DNA binding protein